MDILGNRNLREGNASNVMHRSGDPTETVALPGKYQNVKRWLNYFPS